MTFIPRIRRILFLVLLHFFASVLFTGKDPRISSDKYMTLWNRISFVTRQRIGTKDSAASEVPTKYLRPPYESAKKPRKTNDSRSGSRENATVSYLQKLARILWPSSSFCRRPNTAGNRQRVSFLPLPTITSKFNEITFSRGASNDGAFAARKDWNRYLSEKETLKI